MVKEDGTCDYKWSAQPRTRGRLMRTYTRLTGKNSPPIDVWEFDGKNKKPVTIIYRDSPSKGLLSENFENGRLVKIGNNWLPTFNSRAPVVGISIIVSPYTLGGMHSSHAISAVKYNDTLFAFNAWGENHRDVDNYIFEHLRSKYRCNKLLIYKGPSLQAGDPYGVCVGYANNFILEMLLKIAENKMPRRPTQLKYNDFVHRALTSRGICFGQQCVKENTMRSQWTKIEKNLSKKINTPSVRISASMKLPELKNLVKRYKVKGASQLTKSKLINKLRNEFKSPPTRANLENINFRSATPTPPSPIYKPKPVRKRTVRKPRTTKKVANLVTLKNLRTLASKKCLKGRSRYPRKANLYKFIQNNPQPNKSPLNKGKIERLGAQGLRNYASSHCIKGYSKYTKKSNLRRFLINKVVEG